MKFVPSPRAAQSLVLLPALAIATPASAQLPQTLSHEPADHGFVTTDYRSPVTGCFRIPSIQDLAFLNDEELILCNQPAVFSDMNLLEYRVSHVVVRPGDVLDQMFVLVDGDTRTLEYQPETATFSTIDFTGSLSGQDLLVGGDLDGDGEQDLLAYSASGRTITGLRFQSSTSNKVNTEFVLSAATNVLEIACVDWDSTPGAEVAVMTPGWVEIFRSNGTLLTAFSCPNGTRELTAFRNQGETTDRLAWFWELGNKHVEARVVFDGGQEGPYLIPCDGLAGVNTGDYDGDGETDLVLSARHMPRGVVLIQAASWHKPNLDSFDGSSPGNVQFTLDATSSGSARDSAAVIVDLNGDGIMDLIQPEVHGEEIAVFLAENLNLIHHSGRLMPIRILLHGWDIYGNPLPVDRGFSFTYRGPSELNPEIGAPTELWVTVYSQTGLSGPLALDSYGTQTFPALFNQGSPIAMAEVALDMPQLARNDDKVFYFHIRWASDASGETRYYPSRVQLATNTESIADIVLTWPEAKKLETLVDDEVAGGMMAGPEPTPVFGPQPVDGTGRGPDPTVPPI